jgi:hypothetical protein
MPVYKRVAPVAASLAAALAVDAARPHILRDLLDQRVFIVRGADAARHQYRLTAERTG